jgi:hypothetical protein
MTKKEFEALAMKEGFWISLELYHDVEALYKGTGEEKSAFIARIYGKNNTPNDICWKTGSYKRTKMKSDLKSKRNELKRIARKKVARFSLRMTEIEKELIEHFARADGLTASDFVRRIAIEHIARRAISLKEAKNHES